MTSILGDVLTALKNAVIWWFTVTPWEQAIRVRQGRHMQPLGPGIHLRIPIIDIIYRQPIRLRTIDVGMQTLTTSDGHAITIAGNVQYKICDLLKLYQTIHSPSDTIIDLCATLIAEFIISHTKTECTPMAVSNYATARLDLSQYGLESGRVNITDFAFIPTLRLVQDERVYRSSFMDMAPLTSNMNTPA